MKGLKKTFKDFLIKGNLKVYSGEVLVYPTLREAANSSTATPFCEGHISSCCHGKRNSHKGFYWKFTESFPNPEPRLEQLLLARDEQ